MAKKLKSLNFIVKPVIYRMGYMFSFGETDEVLWKKLKRWGILDNDKELHRIGGGGICVRYDDWRTIIRLCNMPLTPSTYGTLVHEIAHAVFFTLGSAGMKLEVGVSDEAYTYLMGYLTEECYKRLK